MSDEKSNGAAVGSTELLERWELYRAEMVRCKKSMATLAIHFLELEAYEDASRCAIKAEGLKFVIGRMPSSNAPVNRPSEAKGENDGNEKRRLGL